MEARELMIGNLVYYNGQITKIQSFNQTGAIGEMMDDCRIDPNYMMGIEPIPITEEWLVKFDFYKKDPNDWSYRSNEYERTDAVYCFGEDDIVKVKFESEWYGSDEKDATKYIQFYYSDNSLTGISYIHELQNLYFCLTGKELAYATT